MKGQLRQRGKHSWELRFDVGRDPATGKRQTRYHSFRGGKREAQLKLAALVASVGQGTYVEPSKVTVAELVRDRVDQWEAARDITARTAQRYRQLIEHQIVPHLGAKLVQKLKPFDIEAWHNTLRTSGRKRGKGGVAPRTIGHAHRVLSKALSEAAKNELVSRNVAKIEAPPKVESDEMLILVGDEIGSLIAQLRGRAIYAMAITALFTGMRLGEVLALRWRNADIDNARMIYVREALEETKAHGIRFKPPKTKAGRRDLTLPDIVIDALREHRRQQLELRLQLGLGKLANDALVFPALDGGPQAPSDASREWGIVAAGIAMPHVTFHALRHTHASQLIDGGVDVVTISRRLGHANPTVTLAIYAHLFRKDDGKAAAAINAALTSMGRP
jgi:integrase